MLQPPLTEYRNFAIFVEGREFGKYTQAITSTDDKVDVKCDSMTRIKILTYNYYHEYHAVEGWLANKLQSLISNSDDNGSRTIIKSASQNGKLVINNAAMVDNVWSTSYWFMPSDISKPIDLIDYDSGSVLKVKVSLIKEESINVGGKQIKAKHYKVTGGLQADLWFDSANRLVRREMLRKGKQAVLQLNSITFQLPK